MSRTKGSFSLAGAIEPLASAPLDAREKVTSKADLTANDTFPYPYVGMETYVVSENKKYRLIGEDPTDISNWQEVGSGGGASSMSDLSDVALTDLADGQVLKYDATSHKWINADGDSSDSIQVTTMPTASVSLLGAVVQFIGATDSSYTHNYFYECISDGESEPTYSWEQTNVQPSGGSASAVSDLTDVDLDDLADGQVLKWDATEEKWVNDDESGGGDASLESAVTANLAVGAIASGTTLAQGTSFTEFVQKLLITEIAPTLTFSISKSGNVVYGGSYTETLTVGCTAMGTAKKIKSIAWYEGSALKQTDTIDSATTGSWTYTMGTATTDTTTFKAIITYVKSNDVEETVTKTASISFYYNKFYGAVADLTPTEATVEALTTALATGKGGTYSFTTSASRICYAYPKSLGALSSIKDGNGFSLFDSFTRTEETYTQNGASVAYYRYVLTDPTTVSGYSVIFA